MTDKDPIEIYEEEMEKAPELPPRFQEMDKQEIIDHDLRDCSDKEAEIIAEWITHAWQASQRYERAKQGKDPYPDKNDD